MDNNQWNGQPIDPNLQGQQTMDSNMQAMNPNMYQANDPYAGAYNQQPAAPAKKSKKGLIIGIIAAVVVIVAVVVLILVLSKGKKSGHYEKKECEMCAVTKDCKEYEMSFLGETETFWCCDDCFDDVEGMYSAWGVEVKEK